MAKVDMRRVPFILGVAAAVFGVAAAVWRKTWGKKNDTNQRSTEPEPDTTRKHPSVAKKAVLDSEDRGENAGAPVAGKYYIEGSGRQNNMKLEPRKAVESAAGSPCTSGSAVSVDHYIALASVSDGVDKDELPIAKSSPGADKSHALVEDGTVGEQETDILKTSDGQGRDLPTADDGLLQGAATTNVPDPMEPTATRPTTDNEAAVGEDQAKIFVICNGSPQDLSTEDEVLLEGAAITEAPESNEPNTTGSTTDNEAAVGGEQAAIPETSDGHARDLSTDDDRLVQVAAITEASGPIEPTATRPKTDNEAAAGGEHADIFETSAGQARELSTEDGRLVQSAAITDAPGSIEPTATRPALDLGVATGSGGRDVIGSSTNAAHVFSTKTCRHYLAGKCKRHVDCRFDHPPLLSGSTSAGPAQHSADDGSIILGNVDDEADVEKYTEGARRVLDIFGMTSDTTVEVLRRNSGTGDILFARVILPSAQRARAAVENRGLLQFPKDAVMLRRPMAGDFAGADAIAASDRRRGGGRDGGVGRGRRGGRGRGARSG